MPSFPAARDLIDRNRPVLRELTPGDLTRLQLVTGSHMVSVLVPTTPSPRVDLAATTNLSRLIDRAEERLANELADDAIGELIEPLRALAGRVVAEPTARGLALYSGAGIREAYRLPLSPTARAVVDPTFATRDLARALLENPPYRVLSVAADHARLYLGTGMHLHERLDNPFPMAGPRRGADRRGHLHQAERTRRHLRRGDVFVRALDAALEADRRSRGLPLVLAGTEPAASRFRRSSRQQIIGTIPGNHQRSTAMRLAHLAQPLIRDHVAEGRAEALDQLDSAIDGRRATSGVDHVWRAALEGRIHLLLVDPEFVYPASLAPDGRSLTPSADAERAGVLDDAVDETIELVARRHGRTCFTPLDPSHRGIAAVLRTT